MHPIRLYIENFCSYSKSEIFFDDFSSALIVGKIKGNDRFSNGAGKSTIFMAIKYVLFNEVDYSTLDKVVRRDQDHCKVQFDFIAYDHETYRVSRTKGKKAGSEVRLYKKQQDAWNDITQRRSLDTEKEIAKIIKINYKTFCNSVLFSQTDLFGLASLTPGKRKIALKEALQLNIYSKYELATKKKVGDLIKEVDKVKTIIDTLGNPEEDIKKLNLNCKELIKLTDKKNEIVAELKNNYEKENENCSTLRAKYEFLEKQTADFTLNQKNINNEINKLASSIDDYSKKLLALKTATKPLMNEAAELDSDIKKLASIKIDNLSELKNTLVDISSQVLDKQARYKSVIIKLEDLSIPLPSNGLCKYCRQIFSEDARDVCIKSIQEEMNDFNIKKQSLKIEIDKLKNNEQKLIKEISSIEQAINDIKLKQQLLSIKNKEIENKRSLYIEYSSLLNKDKTALQDKNLELNDLKKTQFINAVDEYLKLKSDIDNSKLLLTNFNNSIDNLTKELSIISNNKAVIIHTIEQKNNDIEKIKQFKNEILSLETKIILHQKVIQAFGPGGIPALITHTILDDFQIETNSLLAQLRPGLQLQFFIIKDRSDGDEEDTLDINYMLNGYELEYEQLSGAQKLIVSLALKLGLASVIKKRLGIEIKLLLIDEVDQSLDEGGLEAFEDAIKKLQKDFKILIITHNKELKNRFTHAILVEQDERLVSTAKVVDVW